MKAGVTKQEFIDKYSELLRLTREGIDYLELADNENVVIIHYEKGYSAFANIELDSGIAIIRDIAKQI